MQGWYQMDIDLLLGSTSPEFVFEDPVEEESVDRLNLQAYMWRWDQRMRALGGNNQWHLSHQQRVDKDGILTDWEWWQVLGTEAQGAALVLTGDAGVILERITYFDRKLYNR